jgi:D-alanine-D-alanine ligase
MIAPGTADARPRVGVVFGGRSPEHGISCLTATEVVAAIDVSRFEVIAVGITRSGHWVTGGTADAMVRPDAHGLLEVVAAEGMSDSPPGQPPPEMSQVDVVLPLLHGSYGEDGTVQGLLELADVRYVGSGVLASAAAMHKDVMKTLLAAAGIPVCRWTTFTVHEWRSDRPRLSEAVAALGWPVFVKPARAGSSFGISKVDTPTDLADAVEHAAAIDPVLVVEEMVDGRELECGVLQSVDAGPPDVSAVGEVIVGGDHAFYDFTAKYLDEDALELVIPAAVEGGTVDRVRDLAAAAFDALGCEGLARVDFFLCPDGRVLLNEVNTMPGFTPSSMFPRVWAASGLDYPSLVKRLITTALNRPLGLR